MKTLTNLTEMNAYMDEYRQFNHKLNQKGWLQEKNKEKKQTFTWFKK